MSLEHYREFKEPGCYTDYSGPGGHVDVPEGVKELDGAFFQREDVTSVSLPASLRKVDNFAFADTLLEEVVFPEGMECIGDNTFDGCEALKRVVIPDSVTCISDNAFYNCPEVRLEFTGEHPHFRVENGALITREGAMMEFDGALRSGTLLCLIGRDPVGVYEVPEGVQVIGGYALTFGGDNITEVKIPGTVTEVEALTKMKSLKRVVFPASVRRLGAYMLNECHRLEEVVILGREVKIEEGRSGRRASYGFQKLPPDAAMIAPYLPFASFPKEVKRNVAIGVTHACARGMEVPEETKAEAKKYLKSQRKRLYDAAVKDPELLRFLFEEKLIPAKEVPELLKLTKDGVVKAAILEYQERWLGRPDPLKEMEKEMRKLEREASKTPEEKARKIREEFQRTGTLPAGVAKEEWKYKKLPEGGLMITDWKSSCCELNGGKVVGKIRDVRVPRQIGRDLVVKIDLWAFHENAPQKISNSYQRCHLKTLVIPDSVACVDNTMTACKSLRRLVLLGMKTKLEENGTWPWLSKGFPKELTIAAPAGSRAEACAKELGLKFEAITPEEQ